MKYFDLGFYSEDTAGEIWIKCQKCNIDAHELCAGTEESDEFICEYCRKHKLLF